jgi:aspartate/methionine/tyrosine aminotransferase
MLSGRVDWETGRNDLALALESRRATRRPVLDLTGSNPTRCGLAYPERELLEALSPGPAALVYEPEPRGLLAARRAVSQYYAERGASVAPEDILLTPSTSEAYGYLFKLLCRAGDEVLVPQPSYPLFDFLAALEAVRPVAYPLFFHDGWRVDFGALEAALSPRARALLVVHPNNPTGSYVAAEDRERLLDLGRRRELALVVDEVFLDFPHDGAARESFAACREGLVFVLSGLSKLAGLPQLKLSWVAARGAPARRDEAVVGLEHVADHYLSVGTPVQLAASRLLAIAPRVRQLVAARARDNLAALERGLAAEPAASLLAPEGGWYATLRLPAIQSSESWALDLLESAGVYLHPGSFFGFHGEAFLVVSLLTPPAELERGIGEALRVVSDRMGAGDG